MDADQNPSNNGDGSIDGLITIEEVSSRLQVSSGVLITPRTIWTKAQAAGIGKKIGRSRFVHTDDLWILLKPSRKSAADLARERYEATALAAQRKARFLSKLRRS